MSKDETKYFVSGVYQKQKTYTKVGFKNVVSVIDADNEDSAIGKFVSIWDEKIEGYSLCQKPLVVDIKEHLDD